MAHSRHHENIGKANLILRFQKSDCRRDNSGRKGRRNIRLAQTAGQSGPLFKNEGKEAAGKRDVKKELKKGDLSPHRNGKKTVSIPG